MDPLLINSALQTWAAHVHFLSGGSRLHRSWRGGCWLGRPELAPGLAVDSVDPFHVSAIFGFELPKLSPPRSVTMVFTALVPVLMRETRGGVVLTRIAKRLRKKSGDLRYRARIEDERASFRTLIYISCTRPIRTSVPPLSHTRMLTLTRS